LKNGVKDCGYLVAEQYFWYNEYQPPAELSGQISNQVDLFTSSQERKTLFRETWTSSDLLTTDQQ
jgi:hypothetical protein